MSLRRSPARTLAVFSIVGILGSSYMYYRRRADIATSNQTFEVLVHGHDASGNRTTSRRVLPLLPPSEVENRLTEFAKNNSALRDGIRWNWHTAQVAANNPVEDAFSNVIVERDPPPGDEVKKNPQGSSNGDLLFFTIFDGHGGPYTSRLLSKTLIPMVGLELSSLMHERIPDSLRGPKRSDALSYLRSFVRPLFNRPSSAPRTFDQDTTYVSLAIQTAFARLDSELINAPVRFMESLATSVEENDVTKINNRKAIEDTMARASVFQALSGSCALLALLDTGTRNMYVACTGDSRAVAGYFNHKAGTWTMEVLTEDQTGRNPNELKRIQSEHPPEESEAVIRRGRVLGGLEPTRAFGDGRYKWSREIQERLLKTFFEDAKYSPRPPPKDLKTPPYVTSQPVVTYRTEFLPPPSGLAHPAPRMRFLILATDGLWDNLSSQDACALVAGHLAGLRGAVPKSELESRLKLSIGAHGIEGKDKRQKDSGKEGSWAFTDENLATHLVRNALGRGDETKLRELMSIPPPLARSYRDDITVTVVWWEEGKEAEKHEISAKL